jgi:hypothetical protein
MQPIDKKLFTRAPTARPVVEQHVEPSLGTDQELFRTQDIVSSGKAGGGDAHSKPFTVAGRSVRASRLPDKNSY